MKRMLITGGSGFLGSRLIQYFKSKYDICAPSHQEMDITNVHRVNKVVAEYQPDIIIHCAAMADVGQCQREPDISWQRNVMGSIHMAMIAKEIGAKCILCSSDQVYFATPTNLYAKEKLAAEQECLNLNPDCIFLRLSWMYDPSLTSPTQRSDFFTNLLPKLKTSEDIFYAIHDKRGITDVNEVIQNIEHVIELPGGVYDFGAPNTKTMYETVVQIFSELGLDTTRVKPNVDAFKEQPRDMSMNQTDLNRFGIYFTDTTGALVKHFSKYLK